MTALKDILLALPKLPKADLDQIRQRCVFLAGSKQSGSVQVELNEDWLLDGIKAEVESRGLGQTIPPDFRIKSGKSFAAYAAKSERMRAWLEKHVPNLSRNDKRALGFLVARCLGRYIGKWATPSFPWMLRYIDQIPGAVDQSFPGYLASGMLPMLLRKNRKGAK